MVDAVSWEDRVPPSAKLTLVEFSDTAGPGAEIETDRKTGPAKLFRLVTVTRDVAEEPARNDKLAGLVEIVKSGPTRTGRLRNLLPPPVFAVSVTL